MPTRFTSTSVTPDGSPPEAAHVAVKEIMNEQSVRCRLCGSLNQSTFTAEMGIHFPGLKNIDKPVVWVFPELVVCLVCGAAEFVVPEDELAELRVHVKGDAAAAG